MIDSLKRLEAKSAPVREEAARTLRQAIMNGRLLPGQRLVEKEICELLGISRPPVREAMRELEGEGLIQNIPNRGAIVATITADDAISMVEVQGALVAQAVKLFCKYAGDQDAEQLAAALGKLESSRNGGEYLGALNVDGAFYALLLAGAKNQVLSSTARSIGARLSVFWRLSHVAQPAVLDFLGDLQGILGAIRRRKADEAFRIATLHADNVLRAVEQRLEARAFA